MGFNGASAAPKALILKIESLCLNVKDTGFLSLLQFLLQDGTIGRVEDGVGVGRGTLGHALNLRKHGGSF